MAKNKEAVRDFLLNKVRSRGNAWNWYCGIAADPKQRLQEHGGPTYWAYDWCQDEEDARWVEKWMIDVAGCEGGGGGGDSRTRAVYVYYMAAHTDP